MDNMENKNENVQDQQNAPVDGEYSFFYGHKPEDEQSNSQQAPKAEPEMPKADKKPFWKKPGTMVAGLLVAAMLAGFGGSAIGNAVFGGSSGGTTVNEGKRPTSVINTASIDTSKQMTAAEVYAKNVNSTVGITTQVTTNYWGYTTQSAASGSGFIYSSDGYILTNFHVIESASSIKVTLYDGTSYDAKLVGYDESNDIAVLKIDAENLTPVTIGDSDNLNVGDSVIAIGNPLGELTFSLTSGAVSALDREVTMSNNVTMNLIQTDCAINSGNSGGPLFNSHGEVIGIVSAKYSSGSNSSSASVEGLGFAIPMDDVANMVSDLVKNGYVTGKPIMGISVADVDESVTSYGVPQGAIIRVVTPDLCGAKAGLQAGDIVTKIDNTDVTSASDLTSAIGNYKPGDKVTLTIFRSGETKTVEVTLEESTPEKTEKQNQAQQEYQQEYQQSQQQQQQSQQQQQGSSGWPFGSFGY